MTACRDSKETFHISIPMQTSNSSLPDLLRNIETTLVGSIPVCFSMHPSSQAKKIWVNRMNVCNATVGQPPHTRILIQNNNIRPSISGETSWIVHLGQWSSSVLLTHASNYGEISDFWISIGVGNRQFQSS